MQTFSTPASQTNLLKRGLLALAWLAPIGQWALAQPVKCHLEYAGRTRAITVMPTGCPDRVMPQVEGSSVVFKVVNAAAPAQERGVTIETQTLQNDALQLTHQAHYLGWGAAPTPEGMRYGFTGLQTVANTDQGNTLRYWCERLAPAPAWTEETCPAAER